MDISQCFDEQPQSEEDDASVTDTFVGDDLFDDPEEDGEEQDWQSGEGSMEDLFADQPTDGPDHEVNLGDIL